jgi:hypothetical protein
MDVSVICTWRAYFSSDFDFMVLEMNLTKRGKAEFLNLNVLIFHPILKQFIFWLQNDHLYGLLMNHNNFCYFILKRDLKGTQILKIHIFGEPI